MNLTTVLGWLINVLAALIAAPLLIGIINKTKAFYAGRKGPRLLQLYYDLAKLLSKGSVYSATADRVFRLAPLVTLAVTMLMLMLLPGGNAASPLAFSGDLILFLYLAGLGRMFTVLAALETGSSFEGMGASRECQFAVLAEGVLLAIFSSLVLLTGNFSVSGCLTTLDIHQWFSGIMALIFTAVAFYMVMLCENCRVPFDDPETHLELTMIHEAMILDNSGPDLAAILYGSALKLWVFCAFLATLILPDLPIPWGVEMLLYYLVIALLAVSIGVVESVMARYRFLKVPQLLASALGIAGLAIILLVVFGGVEG